MLEQVNFALKRGSITTIIGLNGSGKTTLLRILLGLEQPDSGRVKLAKGIRIGYMPQQVKFSPVLPLSATALLQLSNRHGGKEPLEQAFAETGTSHLRSRMMHQLSGGEKQRIMLARTLLNNPDLLVLDEPVQGVDIAGQSELYELITNVSKRHNCTVLMVSHDIHLVMASTSNVLCLNRHICCSGSPQRVKNDPAFIELFGDRVARNLALYTHHHDHHHDMHGDVVEGKKPVEADNNDR